MVGSCVGKRDTKLVSLRSIRESTKQSSSNVFNVTSWPETTHLIHKESKIRKRLGSAHESASHLSACTRKLRTASNPRRQSSCLLTDMPASIERRKSTLVGFEPTRGDPISLAGRRLDHSAKVSISCKNIQEYLIAGNDNSFFFLCVRHAETSGFQAWSC